MGKIAAGALEGADTASNMVFASTLIVRGRGLAVVSATGPRSAVGAIGKSLEDVRPVIYAFPALIAIALPYSSLVPPMKVE